MSKRLWGGWRRPRARKEIVDLAWSLSDAVIEALGLLEREPERLGSRRRPDRSTVRAKIMPPTSTSSGVKGYA